MTGLEAIKIIKQMFEQFNNQEEVRNAEIKVVRPVIFFFSQYNKRSMNFFIKEDEVPDFYLEKPISEKEIRSLLTLLNIPHSIEIES